MIPRERALVRLRKRRHHWTPVSEQGFGYRPMIKGFTRRVFSPRITRLLLPALARIAEVPEELQRDLDKLAEREFWGMIMDGSIGDLLPDKEPPE